MGSFIRFKPLGKTSPLGGGLRWAQSDWFVRPAVDSRMANGDSLAALHALKVVGDFRAHVRGLRKKQKAPIVLVP